MERLGSTVIDGKLIDLEKMHIEDATRELKNITNEKEIKKNKLNEFLNNMYV